jgi:hypothetical protein
MTDSLVASTPGVDPGQPDAVDDDGLIEAPPPAGPPRVSVLLVAHNAAATIGGSIRAVLLQSFADFELVIVDDCSTDGTMEVARGFDDPRIRLLSTPRHLGAAAARNIGFDACEGRYVAPIAPGDEPLPCRLARQTAFLDLHTDCALVATATERLTDGKRVAAPEAAQTSPAFLRWALLLGNPLVWSSVLLRRSAVHMAGGLHRENRGGAEDFDLYHRLVQIGSVARIDEVLTLYQHPQPAPLAQADPRPGEAAARMLADAALVLREAYEPILGPGAARAAGIMARHVGHGEPVPDIATLQLIVALLPALARWARSAGGVDEVGRALIASQRAALLRRLVRAALRSGAVSVAALHRAGLLHHAQLSLGELGRGAALGFVRGARAAVRQEEGGGSAPRPRRAGPGPTYLVSGSGPCPAGSRGGAPALLTSQHLSPLA